MKRMKIIETVKVEDCFDGSRISEVLLDCEITKEFILKLGHGSRLQYFEDFARPFFKIRMEGKCDVKGIEGNRKMRVHIKNPDFYSIGNFIAYIEML